MAAKLIKKAEIIFFLIIYALLSAYLCNSEYIMILTNGEDTNYFQNNLLITFYGIAYLYLIRNININSQFYLVRFKSLRHSLFFVFRSLFLTITNYLLSILGISLLFSYLSNNHIDFFGILFFAVGMAFLTIFITLIYLVISYKFNTISGIISAFIVTVFGSLLSFNSVLDTYNIFKIPTFNLGYISYTVHMLLGIAFAYIIMGIIFCIPTKRERG